MLRSLAVTARGRFLSSASTSSATATTPERLFTGSIPSDHVEKRFSLCSGPGGQNVQKNATKAEIRFVVKDAAWLAPELRSALEKRFVHRLTKKGELVVESERTRERHLNLADCFDKLRSTIYELEDEMNARATTPEDTAVLQKRAELAAARRLREKFETQNRKRERRMDSVQL